MTETPLRPPVGRYGPEEAPRPWRRVVAWGALALLVLVVIAWVGGSELRDPVQWKDVGFKVTSASSTDATFDVTKDEDKSATCRVRALSQSFAEVGVRDVLVGPSSSRTQRVTVTIPTAELAVSASVQTCHVVDD
ncbi:DUF4307 domain-containing protein [Cellulomonas sp. HZM]|uniref:DUF4307 domain-containing protein n=1 Tax=Cellulomonas sp. HZM TaxID=1454010 RepID=UPI0004939FD9|nr:DUF4307 domain-containing protein [Cellulomonas sp. HZM]